MRSNLVNSIDLGMQFFFFLAQTEKERRSFSSRVIFRIVFWYGKIECFGEEGMYTVALFKADHIYLPSLFVSKTLFPYQVLRVSVDPKL